MDIADARKLSREERTALIEQIRSMLAGTLMVEGKRCLKCGAHTVVRERTLHLKSEPGRMQSGTISDAYSAMCSDDACGYVAVRTIPKAGSGTWLYGRVEVEFIDGDPFIKKEVPQEFTDQQCERLRTQLEMLEGLEETV